ncbi:MAG: hypothetical protein JOZ14_06490 [Acidobacteria bacterium]|nr:hypothetical protein [Acidobacteriota bacterium]
MPLVNEDDSEIIIVDSVRATVPRDFPLYWIELSLYQRFPPGVFSMASKDSCFTSYQAGYVS